MAKRKTRSKGQDPRPQGELKGRTATPAAKAPKPTSEAPAIPANRANGAAAGPPPTAPPVENALEHATTVLGGALGAGYAGARAVTATLAPDAMGAALLVCMPDEWTTDDEARDLIHRF